MDARLLDYYNRELGYLRELGAEFAQDYPKVAGRLGMSGIEVADPYVERLMEGFSFLTARIQMKMDAEFPRFSQQLLDVVHPNYLAPTPAMTIVQLEPSMNEGSLARGFTLPRGTMLRGHVAPGEQTPCEFSTGHAMTLWPLVVEHAEIMGVPGDLPLAGMGLGGRQAPVRAALRIRLAVKGGNSLEALDLDQLMFHLNGRDAPMQRLLSLLMAQGTAVICHDSDASMRWVHRLSHDTLRHEGFDDEQALLPCASRSFQGYRLLQEYFAFAARFLFFSVNGLAAIKPALARANIKNGTRSFCLTVLLPDQATDLESIIDASHLALHCTPAVNLFERRTDRIAVNARTHEYHVVVDRTRPLDFEVSAIRSVTGHGTNAAANQSFRPLYGAVAGESGSHGAYYAVRREPRLLSETARSHGTRTGYVGSEVFLSLVDQHEAPFSEGLRHVSVQALCTNRDLSLLLTRGAKTDFSLRVSAPVQTIRILRGPSRPQPMLADGATTWRLISHLALNHLNFMDMDAEQGAATLRELLSMYGNRADPVVAKQIDGVRHVRAQAVHRRLPMPGPIVFGRGVALELAVDDAAFSGISPYLLGAVLERFFARHVSINMFTELTLSSLQQGRVAHWPARVGTRQAV